MLSRADTNGPGHSLTAFDAASAALAVAGFAVALWFGERTLQTTVAAAVAFGGAALAAALVPRNPIAAVGVMILLSPFGRLVVQLPVGTMRLEQPAIVAVLVAGLAYWRTLPPVRARRLLPLVLAAAAYLLDLTISSVFVAPDPLASLRIVGWMFLSMVGGVAAAWLTATRPHAVFKWFTAAGVIMAVLGLAAGVLFYLAGPGVPMVGGQLGQTPKVSALAHEANLYAIFLAAVVPFAAEQYRSAPTWRSATALALILGAIGVGLTRSAYIGLLIGLPVYVVLVYLRLGARPLVMRMAALCVAAAVLGAVAAAVLLDPAHRDANVAARGAPTAPQPRPRGLNLGTLDFRLERVQPALAEFATSPIIGLGAYSFEQRHQLADGTPDHIAILAIAVPYESGVVGTIALTAFFVLLLLRLWRATRIPPRAGMAAAYICSVLVLLVAYQATNALHFSFTWLIIGAGAGLTLAPADAGEVS
jgi:O-antigen ligase